MKDVALSFLYNPTIGVSIISNSLGYALFACGEHLTLTNKLLKVPSREVIKSYGIACKVPFTINETMILLEFLYLQDFGFCSFDQIPSQKDFTRR